MQYFLLLFVWGASVAAAAAFTPPAAPSSWFGSLFNRPIPPPVPSAITAPSKPEEEQEDTQIPDDLLFNPLSDAELQTYKDATKEKCINILIASQQRGFYYNGEPIDLGEMVPDIFVNEARIAGDRLAYVMRRAKDGRNYVIVDGEVIGPTSVIPDAHRAVLQLNKKHFAYIMKAEYIRKEFRPVLHLIYDGKDLGEVIAAFDYKLNGDYIIYNKKTADNSWPLYVNGKKVANGSFANFDGKNFSYIPAGRKDAKLTLNGKKLGYGGDLTLKDGHRAYVLGRTPNASELIAEAMMLVKNKNTIDDVVNSLPMFPTLSEAIKIVALSFTKDISKLSCCI